MYKLISQPKSENSDACSSQFTSIDVPSQFLQEAVFAGDRFWELEAAFGRVDGVFRTATGYCGGTLRKPTHKEVSEGRTGHTEVVKVIYDKRKISYKSLSSVFWESHDPTNKDYLRFGLDTHYRSAIFYADEEMKKQTQESKIRRQMELNRRIVTKIIPYDPDLFFLAENQHQKYHLQKDYTWLCESLSLRSTEQFVDSHVACKLNGILAGDKNMVVERLRTLMEGCDLPKQTMLILEGIIEDLEKR
ncbi:uncharacterized protein LOC131235355 [Magnolia sinica]|uniref:uncharacterized protein LOC131235355 n=1 Tax=Magnolia sinica TaxID=86752 RepID=UPI002658BCC1|nr:uncharacterized protein LOC131235355 [Magnolia sinica]